MEVLEKSTFMNINQLELDSIYKNFGNVKALKNISMSTSSGQINCILGDNGAGKSTLVNILSGVFQQDRGEYKIDGEVVSFSSPMEAMSAGISTVYQNLAKEFAIKTTIEELEKFDIKLENPRRAAGTLSGGERQILAIARALYFGAKTLILDEPTSALGVKESNKVVDQIISLKNQNINVILISHNIDQAFMLGDKFFIIKNGNMVEQFDKEQTSVDNLRTILGK